ncbi:MAG TPA: hypothetical protein VNR40_04100 [Steroidobacter sp.]|nr:hypothetical protein [Steroidobacter sp.]
MARVGYQRERVRQHAASEFDHHEQRGQRESDAQDGAAGACRVVVIMIVPMAMRVGMAVIMILSMIVRVPAASLVRAMPVPVIVHRVRIRRLVLPDQTSNLPGL